MNPEKRHLLHDLLDSQRDARREAILSAGHGILRGRRRRRRVAQSLGPIALLAVALLSWQRLAPPRTRNVAAAPPPAPEGRSLTDAELLALFPETPVGLVTLENGTKRLVFPRPGDEERFVNRL